MSTCLGQAKQAISLEVAACRGFAALRDAITTKDQIGSALSDRIPAVSQKTYIRPRPSSIRPGPLSPAQRVRLREACCGAKTGSRRARAAVKAGDRGAYRYRPVAFPRFRQRPGRAPAPTAGAQRNLAQSTALGRQSGVRVHSKINRVVFDPGGDVGISDNVENLSHFQV
jgi:hypothetical protein